MKLDKNTLKSIVKECLVEILAEGLINPNPQHSFSKKVALNEEINAQKSQTTNSISRNLNMGQSSVTQNIQKHKRNSHLDNIRFGNEQNHAPPPDPSRFQKLANNNPIMQDIFADTASTTLQEQRGAESSRPGSLSSRPADKAAQIISENNPEEIFGSEAQSKWAALAFM